MSDKSNLDSLINKKVIIQYQNWDGTVQFDGIGTLKRSLDKSYEYVLEENRFR